MSEQSQSAEAERRGEQSNPCADGCCSVTSHDLSEHDVELDVRVFSALSNDTRYEALRLLAAADDELCACELVPELDVNQSTISRALGALHQADLVTRRKDGRWRYYTTTPRAEKLLTAIDTTRDDIV
jgi:ArsR family transcriptional regulator